METERPRWWYFVLSNCEQGLTQVHWEMTLVNGGGFFQNQFSANEIGVLGTCIIAFLASLLLFVALFLIRKKLMEERVWFITGRITFWSMVLQLIALVFELGYYMDYAGQGIENTGVQRFAQFVRLVGEVMLVTLTLLLGHGYTVVHRELDVYTKAKVGVFMLLYTVAALVAYGVHVWGLNIAVIENEFSMVPGILTVVLRSVVFVWFLVLMVSVMREHLDKRRFYLAYAVLMVPWLIICPLIVATAGWTIPAYELDKWTYGLSVMGNVSAYVVLVWLFWPSASNKRFPFMK